MACVLLADGTRINAADILAGGIDGFVVLSGTNVLKIPKLYGQLDSTGSIRADDDNILHKDDLEAEKQVYRRLKNVPGVARCLEISSNGISLKFYVNGSLRDYFLRHEAPSDSTKWLWIVQATEAVMRCHENGVLVFDIAARNLVVAQDLTLRMIDFANSALLSQDSTIDINQVNFDGCTTALDLLHLSNVIYSILTWQDFHITCASELEWPSLDCMPDLEAFSYGELIQKCWMKEYATAHELLRYLKPSAFYRPWSFANRVISSDIYDASADACSRSQP